MLRSQHYLSWLKQRRESHQKNQVSLQEHNDRMTPGSHVGAEAAIGTPSDRKASSFFSVLLPSILFSLANHFGDSLAVSLRLAPRLYTFCFCLVSSETIGVHGHTHLVSIFSFSPLSGSLPWLFSLLVLLSFGSTTMYTV